MTAAAEPRSRRLAYVEVELGRCRHCGTHAGEHTMEGVCPRGTHAGEHTMEGVCPRAGPIDAKTPWPCFAGVQRHAFIDLDLVVVAAGVGVRSRG